MSYGMQRVLAVPTHPFRTMIQKRATSIHSKPPKGKVGPFETVVGLTVFAMGLFAPTVWILLHLPKQKPH